MSPGIGAVKPTLFTAAAPGGVCSAGVSNRLGQGDLARCAWRLCQRHLFGEALDALAGGEVDHKHSIRLDHDGQVMDANQADLRCAVGPNQAVGRVQEDRAPLFRMRDLPVQKEAVSKVCG